MASITLQCSICQTGFDNEHPPYILVHRGTQGCAANFHQPCARLWTQGCPNCRAQYSGVQKNLALLQVLNELAENRLVPASRQIDSPAQNEATSTSVVASRTLRTRQRITRLAQEHHLDDIEDPRMRRAALRSIQISVASQSDLHREADREPRPERTTMISGASKENFLLQVYISSDKFTSLEPKDLARDLEGILEEIPEASFIVIHSHMAVIFEEHASLTKICKGTRYDRSLIRDKGLAAIVAKFHSSFMSHFLETDFHKIVTYTTKLRADQLRRDQQRLVCRGYIEYLNHR